MIIVGVIYEREKIENGIKGAKVHRYFRTYPVLPDRGFIISREAAHLAVFRRVKLAVI
jgi:hypothetical protein